MRTIRIGSGAGYGGDRIEPAIDLIRRGDLDYIIFECLAERTVSIAQTRRRQNPELGYNDLFDYRFTRILDALVDLRAETKRAPRIVTNMGAANPTAAAKRCLAIARERDLTGLKIVCVTGDDKTDELDHYLGMTTIETGAPLSDIDGEVLSANGYIGCAGIVEALDRGADIVITGRVADPSLALGPLVHEFGWSMDDYTRLGRGTWVGHLLECAGQVCGGYFADPGHKEVPDLWNLGFPIIEVDEEGNGVITKLPGTGGLVSVATVQEQTLYEIQNPHTYFTPDVVADFSQVRIEQEAENRVKIHGADGAAPNGFFKTSVGYHDCFIGEGQISYGGENALAKAELARDVLEHRFEIIGLEAEEVRFDYIGFNSLYGDAISHAIRETSGPGVGAPIEIRLRVAARTKTAEMAHEVGREVEALYTNGPAGGGGATASVRDIISIASILIPSSDFTIGVELLEA